MSDPVRPEVQVVITTASYRAGQAAAWKDFEKDPDMQPNRALLARLKDEEFAAGYCDEYNVFITPARARMPRPFPEEEEEGPLHWGSLLSGTITCDCGWESQHWVYAADAQEEFAAHLVDVGVTT